MEHAPRMDWTSDNLAESFKLFEQRLQLFFKVKKIQVVDQPSHILLQVGEEGLRRFNSWTLTADEQADPAVILQRFREQLEPAENFRVSRLRLMGYRQQKGERLDDFVNRAKLQAQKCEFSPAELDERLLELIIASAQDTDFQKNLLSKEKTFTLQEALKLGRTYEATASHVKQLKDMGSASEFIEAIKIPSACRNCGGRHEPKKCPAYGSSCRLCGKPNHWAKVCRSPETSQQPAQRQGTPRHPRGGSHGSKGKRPQRKVHHFQADQHQEESDFDMLTFNNIQASSMTTSRDEAYVKLEVQLSSHSGVHQLQLKVDTGAQGNTLPLRVFRQMFPDLLTKEGQPIKKIRDAAKTTRLTAYNGTNITCLGMHRFPCRFATSRWHHTPFYIVDVPGPAIVGLPSSEQLKLVTMHCSVQRAQPVAETAPLQSINSVDDLKRLYPQQFDKIGQLPGEARLIVDPNVPPRVNPPRKTPIALKDAIQQELTSMENSGVIKRVIEPTDWVSSLAYSRKKDGNLRICLDPRHLNKALKRPHHKIPTVEELTHKFQGAKVFSKLDAKSGYWSVQLHPESQLLTTFQSPFGRYCFQRLPFGLSVSQDVFQLKMDQILDQVDGVVGIADDVAVYAKTDQEHDQVLHNLFKTAQKNGLVFNSDKCHIKTDSITFFGMTYDANGAHPDSQKIADLQKMPAPANKQELQTFLGFVQFLAPFIPNLAEKSAVLRDLLKKEVPFVWESHHQASVNAIKNSVSETSTLRYFDTTKTPTLQVDASIKGLGASLLQEGQPVAYASKALSDAETRYACIERELLAVVFGVQRFHTYLYGRPFKVITDHKPLVMILQKPLTSAPPRLQRMLLKLQGYNFEISHQPGTTMSLADTLSRLPNRDNKQEIDLDVQVDTARFSSDRIKSIQEETRKDETLAQLTDRIINGWPDSLQEVPPTIRAHWSYRDELSVIDGLVLKGSRIVIPQSLKENILDQLHYGHQGIEKTRLRARESVFWDNINKDVETMIKNCPICQEHQPAQQRETLLPHDIPKRPWEVLGTDMFNFQGAEYLLVADYYSKYFIVRKLGQDTTSSKVISALKQVFAEHGLPEKVFSDNGPQFSSGAFSQFAEQWSFQHITSSPHYPKSNGFIERHVQTVKAALTKAQQAKTDPDLVLLCLRTTPISPHLPSPMEILTGRKAKSNVPTKLINPQPKDNIRQELQQRQLNQKMQYDKTARDLPPLTPGQQVRHQDLTGNWKEGEILRKCEEPRSYIVTTPAGQVLRRNRIHLRDVPQPVEYQPPVTPVPAPQPAPPEPSSGPVPQPHKPSQTKPHAVKHANSNNTPYITRSGRAVHPPAKLDM